MADIAERFGRNPLLRPEDVPPSRDGLAVTCLLNPGAFRFRGKTWLLLRVAEAPVFPEDQVGTLIHDPEAADGLRVLTFRKDDPRLDCSDPRIFRYDGEILLTTLSHLRLASSRDGIHFEAAATPTLTGQGALETYGIEDCRVTAIEGRFYLTYTAVSPAGIAVGLASTADWEHFERHGVIFPPCNKDCALFPERVGGRYWALHRPASSGIGSNDIWVSRSPDLLHWGDHECLARVRPGMWDSARIGAGAAPIRTTAGWLEIYHGADARNRYCLGALLLDGENPARVIARSQEPIMEPLAEYERQGFYDNVVFTNGHVVDGDTVTLYYGASDSVICGATLSIRAILATLGVDGAAA